jgi:hypothetical protein
MSDFLRFCGYVCLGVKRAYIHVLGLFVSMYVCVSVRTFEMFKGRKWIISSVCECYGFILQIV